MMTEEYKNIAIIGAGGLGKEMVVLIAQINALKPVWNIVGFYDDNQTTPVCGIPMLGPIKAINSVSQKLAVVLAIGDPATKQKIAAQCANPNLYFPNLIHPAATVGLNINLHEGVIITAGCRLTVNINIGKHVLLNLNTTIGHDVTIGDYAALMPGVHISGFVQIGTGAMLGTGATVLQQIKIGPAAKVGACALVTKDVAAGTTVIGIPATEKR